LNGWSLTWSEKYKTEALQHEDLPNLQFQLSFPVFPAAKIDTSESSPSLLEFKAEKCELFLGTSYVTIIMSSIEAPLRVDLSDSNGRWVGVIESTYMRDNEYGKGTSCDIVAILEGRAPVNKRNYFPWQYFDELKEAETLKELDEYNVYKVLWREWVEGIAYKKAMGRVWKEA
jgi:hypothetical protein